MKQLAKDFKALKYTMFHPANGFYLIKWDDTGSVRLSIIIMVVFFLVNVFRSVLTGFIYNNNNPDLVSVISIFAVAVGGLIIWFIANVSISSFMFTEGKTKHIFILTCYSIVPYCIWELIYIFLSNFLSSDLKPFLSMIRVLGLLWSFILLFFGSYQVHQLTVGGVVKNLILTVIGMLILIFLLILGYSLMQQLYVFIYTIYNEILFRI